MLAPNSRELLMDALRPEPGYTLDAAVGTSFTMDLEALILVPLAFALFDTDGESKDLTALLAAIQQYAGRMAVYCDPAGVRVRDAEQKLAALLEDVLLPVPAPRGGSFHPKLWFLRFRDSEGSRLHRILVLSRNLTFDTSWDLITRLDQAEEGAPIGRDAAGILRGLSDLRESAVAIDLARSISPTRFAIPAPFESGALHATGLRATGPPSDPTSPWHGQFNLVISPFLKKSRLAQLGGAGGSRRAVISRPDELDRLGASALQPWQQRLILRSGANPEPSPSQAGQLTGLHAKLLLAEAGDTTTWFVGSANATVAAVESNVEAFLELHGPTRKVGRAALLKEGGDKQALRDMLEEYPVQSDEPVEQTPEELEQERIDLLAREISRLPAELRVRAVDGGRFRASLSVPWQQIVLEPKDRVECRLVTRSQWVSPSVSGPTELGPVGKAEVTSLVAVRIRGAHDTEQRLVLLVRLLGAPADRLDSLLLSLVPDQDALSRLLALMLVAGDVAGQMHSPPSSFLTGRGPSTSAAGMTFPLYESMVRAVARDPEALGSMGVVMERFRSSEDGRERIPEGLNELWDAFVPLLRSGR